MPWVQAITLSERCITLLPLTLDDEAGLIAAASDGELWRLRVTSVPEPENTRQYIDTALQAWREGHRLALAVTDSASGKVLGCTSYHDILPAVKRLEIGFTWYAASVQRTHVNTSCKLMMLTHAFESLGAKVVGWRTDNFNFASQRAIERLMAARRPLVVERAFHLEPVQRDAGTGIDGARTR
jgi:RimJ/RimL family protein N-acetyltransferase